MEVGKLVSECLKISLKKYSSVFLKFKFNLSKGLIFLSQIKKPAPRYSTSVDLLFCELFVRFRLEK